MMSAPPPAALFFKKSRRGSVVAGDIEASVSKQVALSDRPAFGIKRGAGSAQSSQIFVANRQATQALARGLENSIANRRRNHRNGWLANPRRRFRAGHDVNLNGRSLVHADHRVVIEIGLHDAAAIHSDGILYGCGERINGSALYLGAHAVGINGAAAIHRANNRSEEHTSELQSRFDLVCRLLLEKKKTKK